jgi:Na+/H+ antiporter NhaD/arsenite permease-like protein
MLRAGLAAALGLFAFPQPTWAAGEALDVHPASVAPFVVLLLTIALLPLLAKDFWHSNFHKLVVALALAAPVVGYFVWLEHVDGQPALAVLEHILFEYADFMILLATLYTVAGGIVLEGNLRATPWTNTLLLALGAVLANLIGTTGASMLLIRPFLRMNAGRSRARHLPVFFIFIVSNLGGLLTPLGDPPLFLGFLRGIDFFWTLQLTPHWLVALGCTLTVFFMWDAIASIHEPPTAAQPGVERIESRGPLRLRGKINFIFLVGILAGVLLLSEDVARELRAWLNQFFACPELRLLSGEEWAAQLRNGQTFPLWAGAVLIAMAFLSLLLTSSGARQANHFTWHPIIEVAVLFLGIFITMMPALHLVIKHGKDFGITEPWQYFWLTGSLSAFLDNAPTYVTFATLAAGQTDLTPLMFNQPLILAAISCGAVFMGATTYIGNGPNFMVKAIAESMNYRTPSFLGYMLYSIFILLPTFGLVTWLFFWPG